MNLLYLNQFKTTTLSVPGGIDASQTDSIVAQSVSGIDTTKPGVACVSYSDPINVDNAEWFEYQSINSTTKEFQGVVRGAEGYSAKSHDNGAVIAFPVSESHINRLADALSIGSDPTNGVTGVIDDDTMATASATTLATSESVKAYVDNGWLNPNESWSYASPTTINVPSGAASRYQKGMPFKVTANSVELQGYIVGIADTLLTVVGDALTDHTFTNNYYAQSGTVPIGFKESFSWTPVVRGSTTEGTGTYTTQQGRFSIHGRECTFEAYLVWSAHTGTGNLRTTIPLFSRDVIGRFAHFKTSYISNLTLPANTVFLALYSDRNNDYANVVAVRDATTPSSVAMDTAAGIMYSGTYEYE